MAIITIRGQMGSGAPEIGKNLAKKLKIDYLDREIIARVATRAKRKRDEIAQKEKPPVSFLERIEEFFRNYPPYTVSEAAPIPLYLPTWEIPLDDERYVQSLDSVVKKLAEKQSLVIRGRGSQFILKHYPDSFHIMVIAPLDVRIKNIMMAENCPEEEAKKLIERSDKSHIEFIRRYFKADLEAAENYDLVINTKSVDNDKAVRLIKLALPFKIS